MIVPPPPHTPHRATADSSNFHRGSGFPRWPDPPPKSWLAFSSPLPLGSSGLASETSAPTQKLTRVSTQIGLRPWEVPLRAPPPGQVAKSSLSPPRGGGLPSCQDS